MAEIVDFAWRELPGEELHRALHGLRSRHPVHPAAFGDRPAFIVTGHAALAEAFRDNVRFPPADAYRITIEPVQGLTFQTMEGEQHRLYRQLATPAFRSRAVESMESRGLAAIAHELIDRLPANGEADFCAAFTHRFSFLVISRMLGIPFDREDAFREWAMGFLAFERDPDYSRRCAREMTEYLTPILTERRREPRDDIISSLATAEVEGHRLDDEEILAHIRLLFSAGASTTTDAMGNLVYTLLSEPHRWEAVKAQSALREGAVEELLRWETPVAVLPRVSAPEPVELAGVEIPAASFVLFAMAAANRDPEVFEDPDRFDPQRDSTRKLLSFGPGPRLCPGMHLARKQLRVVLDVLVDRLPQLRLIDPTASQPTGTVLRGPKRLAVSF